MGKKNTQVGARIAALRKARGLTQEQLAERLHVTRQAVSSWETANSYPDVEMLAALSEALEVSIEELIYGTTREKVTEELPRWMKVTFYVLMLVMGTIVLGSMYGEGAALQVLIISLLGTLYYGILVIRDGLRGLK